MHIALVSVFSHEGCTLKDVAGGFGTVFDIGQSWRARLLARAKSGFVHLPAPVLGYLAARAAEGGHTVSVHELRRTATCSDPVPRADVAVVLTSIVDAPAERAVIRELRRLGVRTVAVGAFATAQPEYFGDADVVARGEPENLPLGPWAPDLAGVIEAGFVTDLDALPIPDWSAFGFHKFRYGMLTRGAPVLPVQSARGCAYGCDYCPFRVTAPFRERSVDGIIAEVAQGVKRYGARGIAFRDPLFNFDRERVLGVAERLRPLDVRFSAEMRADRVDEDLLERLAAAGLRSLEIGVESVNREMLKAHHRAPPELAQIERVTRKARELNVRVIANFMMGLPDDDEASIRETVAFAKKLNTFAVQFTVATPYPGTRLGDEVQSTGASVDPERMTGWEPTFQHPTLSADRLRALREDAYVGYHYRPRYAVDLARQLLNAALD